MGLDFDLLLEDLGVEALNSFLELSASFLILLVEMLPLFGLMLIIVEDLVDLLEYFHKELALLHLEDD